MPAKARVNLISSALALGVLTSGCATGSSASFTMAPLFFSEASDSAGEIVAAGEKQTETVTFGPYRLLDQGMENYVAASGNALLPVNAVSSPLPLLASAGGSSPVGPLLGANGAITGVAVSPLGPISLSSLLAGAGGVANSSAVSSIQVVASVTNPVASSVFLVASPVQQVASGVVAAAAPSVSGVSDVFMPIVQGVAVPAAHIVSSFASVTVPIVNAVAAPAAAVTTSVAPAVAPVTAPLQQAAANIAAPVTQVVAPTLVNAATVLSRPNTAAPPATAVPALLSNSVTGLIQACLMGMCR